MYKYVDPLFEFEGMGCIASGGIEPLKHDARDLKSLPLTARGTLATSVPPLGLEPRTSRLEVGCAIRCAKRDAVMKYHGSGTVRDVFGWYGLNPSRSHSHTKNTPLYSVNGILGTHGEPRIVVQCGNSGLAFGDGASKRCGIGVYDLGGFHQHHA